MEISASLIKEVKEKTGAGIVDCKQTLIETKGDVAKAVEILKRKGLSKADKKEGRAANEGIVVLKIEGKKGLVLKINCETDFVAKTDDFNKFVSEALELIFKKKYPLTKELPADLEELRRNVIAKIGENILISDWKFIDAKGELYPYTHRDMFKTKVAVVADFGVSNKDDDTNQMMKNFAMQITAMNPISVDADSVPKDKLEELKKAFTEEAKLTGKPDKIIETIVKGKLEKFFNESILLEQLYIFDEEKKVKQVLDDFEKAKGVPFKVNSFVRVSL